MIKISDHDHDVIIISDRDCHDMMIIMVLAFDVYPDQLASSLRTIIMIMIMTAKRCKFGDQ